MSNYTPRHRAPSYLERVWNRLRHPGWAWGMGR